MNIYKINDEYNIYFDDNFIDGEDNEYIQNFNFEGLIKEWIMKEYGYLDDISVREHYGSIDSEEFNKELKSLLT